MEKLAQNSQENIQRIVVSSLHEIDALTRDDLRPIVINGDSIQYAPAMIADIVRKEKSLTQPILYLCRSRILSTEERVEYYDAGGDMIVDQSDINADESPSVEPLMLQKKLRALSQSHGSKAERILSPQPRLTLDTATLKVTVDGVSIPFTVRQFNFIALLAKNENRPTKFNEFWEKLFDGREAQDLLRAHISRINAITQERGFVLIESVREVGYSLADLSKIPPVTDSSQKVSNT